MLQADDSCAGLPSSASEREMCGSAMLDSARKELEA